MKIERLARPAIPLVNLIQVPEGNLFTIPDIKELDISTEQIPFNTQDLFQKTSDRDFILHVKTGHLLDDDVIRFTNSTSVIDVTTKFVLREISDEQD